MTLYLSLKRYLLKNNISNFKKYKIKLFIKLKYKKKKIRKTLKFFSRKKFIYPKIYWKAIRIFYPTVSYNAYQNNTIWLKKKYNNIKYHKMIDLIRNKVIKFTFIKRKISFSIIKNIKIKKLISFLYLYNYFINSIFIDLFYFRKSINFKKNKFYYYLFLSFYKNKLFVNFKNRNKKNFLSISSGLFIKFFEKKKSFKKNKTIKLLISKYIRKIFLLTRIKNTILVVKKTPVFLMEVINLINSPIAHKFVDPVDNKVIEETNTNNILIKFLYFIFMENKNFTKNKIPAKGRIKRKILRKVVFENKIID